MSLPLVTSDRGDQRGLLDAVNAPVWNAPLKPPSWPSPQGTWATLP